MMVDNLGKNMMLDTFNGKIWYPRFYDMDTICSYNNSGEIKYDVDIEMAQGYWNTSASRLWTKIRDNFHDELVAMYAKMRANGLSYDSLMSYFYGQQISKIPETYYNKDADTKYLPFATQYMGMAHGNGYEHLKRWLKNRLIFTDTLYDYAPSYNNDVLTIRANTTEPMSITIETYTPLYQHVSWYNNQMDKKKIDGKTSVTFTGTAMTATDQEVLIYGGSNIKRITGMSSMNPNSMLIGSATRLIELDISNCPILATVNATGSNFSPHTYINKLDISDCPNLTGTLRINNSPLLRELDFAGTGINNILKPKNFNNLEILKLSDNITDLSLTDARLLRELTLSQSLTELVLKNIPSLTIVNASSCDNLNSVIIENPVFNPFDIVSKATNLESVRLINIDCTTSSNEMSRLAKLKGLDTNGNEIAIAEAVTGKVTLRTCMDIVETRLKAQFPNVEFTVLKYVEGFTVTFYDGDNNVIYTTAVESGGTAVYEGETPTKTSSAQYNYEFSGWNRSLENIMANTVVRPLFNEILRQYTITFVYPNGTVIQESLVNYGEIPTPPDASSIEGEYDGWTPDLVAVTGDTEYTARPLLEPPDYGIFIFTEIEVAGEQGYNCQFDSSQRQFPTQLIYPSYYNGKKVLSITGDKYSQSNKDNIKSVYLPRYLKIIGTDAFAYMRGINKIEGQGWNSVTTIGNSAFYYVNGNRLTLQLPESLTSIEDLAFYDFGYSASYKPTVILPNSLDSLGTKSFYYAYCNIKNTKNLKILNSSAIVSIRGNILEEEGHQPFESVTSLYTQCISSLIAGYCNFANNTELTFPEVTYAKKNSIESIGGILKTVRFPKLTEVEDTGIVHDYANYSSTGSTNLTNYIGAYIGSESYPVTAINALSHISCSDSSVHQGSYGKFVNVITQNGLLTDITFKSGLNPNSSGLVVSKTPMTLVNGDNSITYGKVDNTYARCLGIPYTSSGAGDTEIPEKIDNLPITTINHRAFAGSSMTTFTSNYAEVIEHQSLAFCNNLTTVNLPAVKVFRGQPFTKSTNITTINIPNLERIEYYGAFKGLENLRSVTLSNLKAINTGEMFAGCKNIESIIINGETTLKYGTDFTSLYDFLYYCNNLKYLDLSALDFSECNMSSYFFNDRSTLEEIIPMKNIYSSSTLYFDNLKSLSKDSIIRIFNNLKPTSNSNSSIRLNSTLLAQLTEEEIAIATNKGWSVR